MRSIRPAAASRQGLRRHDMAAYLRERQFYKRYHLAGLGDMVLLRTSHAWSCLSQRPDIVP